MGNTESNPPTARGVCRRELLAGGLGGLVGLAGGVAEGRTVLAATPVPPPPEEKKLPEGTKLSYAQFGDDLVTASLFGSIGIEKPTYLDIGAYEPIADNNTYLFYLAGARGVLVEPNTTLTEKLKTTRPGDTLLVVGIGPEEKAETDYYMMSGSGLNTFDKEQAERIAREGQYKIEKMVKMPMVGINRVIAEHFDGKAPDFLSIDIEGLDYAVLKTLDFTKYRPKIVCAETLITHTLRNNPNTTKLLLDNGYEVRGMTFPNTFYMDKKLLG